MPPPFYLRLSWLWVGREGGFTVVVKECKEEEEVNCLERTELFIWKAVRMVGLHSIVFSIWQWLSILTLGGKERRSWSYQECKVEEGDCLEGRRGGDRIVNLESCWCFHPLPDSSQQIFNPKSKSLILPWDKQYRTIYAFSGQKRVKSVVD